MADGSAGAGLTGVLFSSPWSWFEQEQGTIRYDYLDWVAEAACSNTGLKVAFILDMVRAPAWVFAKWPDARAADSHGREYQLLSLFHEEARKLAMQVVGEVTKHLVDTHRDCVVAVQPVFNNEYEARYTQEHDCYQDYSAPALTAFRSWLRARRPRVEDVNSRWGSSFGSWEELKPPVLEAGSYQGVDMSPKYWDFMRWREAAGAEVFNAACAAVQAAGALCFHHVPEFFTVLDAVYGTSMIKHIAASPHTDFLIVDSGLRTPYGTVMNPTKLRMFVGAVVSYGKPVHFEAAVRPDVSSSMAAYELLGSAARNALLAGARGLGVTGWLGRLAPDAQLAAALQPPPLECPGGARGGELVGVFIHMESCMAWHGLQWHSARKDPLHDFVQDLADTLSTRCDTDVVVHVELERFAADLLGSSSSGSGAGAGSSSSRSGGRRFDRIIFVEPLVLTAKELDTYALVKAAVASLPPTRAAVLRLPANNTAGVQLQVHEEL
ncbi:hypothetical protein HYH02_002277 [Chlamydomonas schloesseri]|uniref:Glycoside hydrolase family 42 N-terminal domain-containing protein n=1 Tax=Chlamydomonas schloesseri TaxID=2026947 RepID=A0A835WUX5_9CHLO|nr:hypothetical protein HYH02_002277 [Chlamydomonas schloesseri]|eukprot:KAG2452940.1 hypothetical protein HYH02_002277 [Chlamydomonas schloesseri]